MQSFMGFLTIFGFVAILFLVLVGEVVYINNKARIHVFLDRVKFKYYSYLEILNKISDVIRKK